MSVLKRNLIANYLGSVWTGLMSFIFIPVYVRLMGIESYGLVGFFATLLSVFAILDLGLSTTLNREFARSEGERPRQRNLLRSVETIYWIVALFCGATVIAFAGVIAEFWVRPEQLTVATIRRAIMLMGLVILFQWPLSMYSGGLQGLQKQVTLNAVNVVMATLRAIGAIVALLAIAPTVTVYFSWQVIVSLVHTTTVAIVLWRTIGGAGGAAFDRTLLQSIWRFAAGMVGISLVSTMLVQVDKVVVSKVLTLATFGYYAIASTVATSLYRIITPVFSTLFPRFSQLVAAGDEPALAALYHRSAEALAVIVLPAAVYVAFFSRELLLLWTRDPVTADRTSLVLSLLILGTALNGVMTMPYAIQLAYGWTRLPFLFNAVALVPLVPLVYFLAKRYGAVGASIGWLAYNAAGALVVPLIMHRRLLRGEHARFLFRDVGAPLLAAALVAGLCRLFIRGSLPLPVLLPSMLAAAAVVQLAAMATIPSIRSRAVAAWPFPR